MYIRGLWKKNVSKYCRPSRVINIFEHVYKGWSMKNQDKIIIFPGTQAILSHFVCVYPLYNHLVCTNVQCSHASIMIDSLPSKRGSIGWLIRVSDRESQQNVTIRLVFLDINSVIALGKDGGVVITVLDVDIDQNTGAQTWWTLIQSLHLQHWN